MSAIIDTAKSTSVEVTSLIRDLGFQVKELAMLVRPECQGEATERYRQILKTLGDVADRVYRGNKQAVDDHIAEIKSLIGRAR